MVNQKRVTAEKEIKRVKIVVIWVWFIRNKEIQLLKDIRRLSVRRLKSHIVFPAPFSLAYDCKCWMIFQQWF